MSSTKLGRQLQDATIAWFAENERTIEQSTACRRIYVFTLYQSRASRHCGLPFRSRCIEIRILAQVGPCQKFPIHVQTL